LSKLTTLPEAIRRLVPDGSSVVLGAGLEALVPFAAGYELVRQSRTNLTLIAPISDMLFDVLIGAGCAGKVIAAWVGNVSAGSGYNFRRAVEESVPNAIDCVDHSNLTLALALQAAAWGVPYLPTRSTLGTDLLAQNAHLTETSCPFTREPLVAVEALAPDAAILPVQRADEEGNAHVIGNLGIIREAARASRRVIAIAQEVVPPDVLRREPNRTVLPGFLVSAVVPLPFACHPSPCEGAYGRDHAFFHDYHQRSRSRDGFLRWLAEWVLTPGSHEGYLERLGAERLDALREL
jgi:glutaconate CoA-transferase subunit A